MPEHQFIFIGGLHRSGTTLLGRLLAEHPQISGFRDTGATEDEGQHLQSVYPAAQEFGGPGRFGFNSNSFLDERSPLVSPENAEKLFRQWSPYWDLQKPFLLEKSPPNLVRTRFLQALFPNSRFIIVMRHPIAVSYATKKWSHARIHSLIEHWLVCYERFESDRPYLNRVLVLRYENLIADPGGTLDRIYEFLGLETAAIASDKIRQGVNDRYFNWWGDRRNPIKFIYTRYIINRFESRVNHFGYSLRQLISDPLI